MKTLSRTVIAVLLLLPSSCETLDVLDGRGRGDGQDALPKQQKEEIYYTTVEFPPGYDWLRDTLAGSSSGVITLYRNHLRFLDFAFGPDKRISSDPDTHYLMGGKLYTQYSTADSTYIKCNGRSFLQFAGREYIKGMLLRRNDFWTIGQLRDAEGFNLRCNGRIVGRRDGGVPFGDMVSGPHRALYEDDENLCYCYKETESSHQICVAVIEDNEYRSDMSSVNLLDCIVMDHLTCKACNGSSGLTIFDRLSSYYLPELKGSRVRDCHLFPCRGKLCIAGTCSFPDGRGNVDFVACDRQARIFEVEDLQYVYPCPNGIALLYRKGDGTVLELPEESVNVDGIYNAYTRNAVWTDGKKWIWGLNPPDLNGKPCIMTAGDRRELELYGYVSCVEIIPTQ